MGHRLEEQRRGSVSAGGPAGCDLLLMQSLIKIKSLMKELYMASMTIRNIDDQLKTRLRIQAATHGRSMEDEARDILRSALSTEPTQALSLVDAIRARIEPLGGIELELPSRESIRGPVDLGE
jgi:plasmid stability protein